MFFVCHACQPKTIPSDSEGDNKLKRKRALSVKAGPTIQENPSQKDPIFPNNAVPQALKEREDDKQTANNPSTQTGTDNQEKSKSICRFYENGNCKHGLRGKDCKFLHRRMCRKFTQHAFLKTVDLLISKELKDNHQA